MAILLLGLVGGFLAGRASQRTGPQPEPAATETAPPPAPPPVLQVTVPPLGRQDLIAAASRAADAFAIGQPGQDSGLIGRRFEIRLPFGCRGPLPDDSSAPLRWSHDAERGVLRLSAQPRSWEGEAWARALATGKEVEAIEGFWISRPWSMSDDCPQQPAITPQAAFALPSDETLGLAQFFPPGSSRLERRNGKPYDVIEKVKLEALNASQGFRLVLRGRVQELANGDPVRCHAANSEARPVCLVAVSIDHVAFTNPATGRTLAEWRS